MQCERAWCLQIGAYKLVNKCPRTPRAPYATTLTGARPGGSTIGRATSRALSAPYSCSTSASANSNDVPGPRLVVSRPSTTTRASASLRPPHAPPRHAPPLARQSRCTALALSYEHTCCCGVSEQDHMGPQLRACIQWATAVCLHACHGGTDSPAEVTEI